jgi:GT2 family glycosyltransferase
MKILAVMVRYQMPLNESQTFRGLCAAFESDPDLAASYEVMIWDNSPAAIDPEEIAAPHFPASFLYRRSSANLGPSGAFNEARKYALEHGHDWMLLLDQDMEIHADFLRVLPRHREYVADRSEIAAIAPTVYVGSKVLSPRQQLFNRHRTYPARESGVASGEAFAINSGCLVRVSALEQIGGFSTDFWLDYSDMYVFHQFFLHGMQTWRAADAELQHDMTIMDYDRLMSPWRYRNFSAAEGAFNDLYKGRLENAVQTLRVFVRALRQRRKYRNPEFSRIAWAQFVYRLRVPRAQRIARWLAEGRERAAQQQTGLVGRPVLR